MEIKIFLNSSNLEEILEYKESNEIKGYITSPSLMKESGVKNYMEFALQLSSEVPKDKHVSFGVISDDFEEMERQARKITSISENFYAKIPITNTKGEPSYDLVKRLGDDGVKINVTAITTTSQLNQLGPFLNETTPSVVSYLAGTVSDTGEAPISTVLNAYSIFRDNKSVEFLWEGCRQVYNIYEANSVGCNIIPVPSSLLPKLKLKGKSLTECSLDAVKTSYEEGMTANYFL